jgi:hypothetical protein
MSYARLSPHARRQALELLYHVADTEPESFDGQLVDLLRSLIPGDPTGTLAIIAKYLSHFDELHEPWPVIDILFSFDRRFIRSVAAADFVNLIFSVCAHPEVQEARHQQFTDVLVNACTAAEPAVVAASCRALSLTGTEPIDLERVDSVIGRQLINAEVAPSIFQLLLRKGCCIGPLTIEALVARASTTRDLDACAALLRQAATKEGAFALVQNPKWLVTHGRFSVWALRIFLTILLNHSLRMDLVQLSETQIFLNRLAEIESPEVMKLLSTITKRLVISQDALPKFQTSHFLAHFCKKVIELADGESLQAAMMCLDAFVDVGYIDDYIAIIPELKTVLGRQDKTAAFVIRIIAKMARFPQCCPALAKNGFPRYFDALKGIQAYHQQCSIFEKNFKRSTR